MQQGYFNYRYIQAETNWQRREFAQRWWRIYRSDPRWVPPPWAAWRQIQRDPLPEALARLSPQWLSSEALARRAPRSAQPNNFSNFSSPLFEAAVAAAILLTDRRRRDATAYAAHLQVVNDQTTLKRLLEKAGELLEPLGIRRIFLPTGLSPYLQSGVLQDYFHQLPPLHTPYNPPYLPEIMAAVCRPVGRSQLYSYTLPQQINLPTQEIQIEQFAPNRLATDLLPLFHAALPRWAEFPLPDEHEARFLLDWVGQWPLEGWLATVKDEAVGFILLQPDIAPVLRRSGGGRSLLWRLWLRWRSQQPVQRGRILWGGVLPVYRRQGIGRQLWHQAVQRGMIQGWKSLTVGPLPTTADGNLFLQAMQATPAQSYLLHRYDF